MATDGPITYGSVNAVSVRWIYEGRIASELGNNGSELQLADLDGDGRAEYLWVHLGGSVDACLDLGPSHTGRYAGIVSWKSLGTIATGIGKSSTGNEFGDISGDARAEYLWVDPSNGAVTAYLNCGVPMDGPTTLWFTGTQMV